MSGGHTPFGTRASGNHNPGLNPLNLPNMLWWDDVGSVTPRPANGASITTIPTFHGTPTTQSGIAVSMQGTFGGGFPGTYRYAQMPSGADAVDMRGAQFAHQGGALTAYASNNPGGLTIYERVFFYTGILSNTRGIWFANTGAQTMQSLVNCPVDANDYTFTTNGSNLSSFTGGAAVAGSAHTICQVVPASGQWIFYLDGLPLASKPSGQVTFETSSSGFGATIGQGDNTSTYAVSSYLAYNALHTAGQVAGISRWLRLNR